MIKRLEGKGRDLGIKHCSNSASTIKFPNHSLDMVRCGIALYGYPPVQTDEPFLPVMEVKARVIAIRKVLPGDGVSYGHTYKVEQPRVFASIGIGYADGYQRLFSNQDFFVFKQ
ncbi:hypothetical protein HF295_03660 [Hujiaoplasma nucleasis]|uniref:Alanine racemase C-terminal domain-containing protein n=1 Tax=Hujiaoplasma nucleasis TaxID=2725268 RepID=A0A7L6N3I8_9MOLU|nr:hypothetical protein HF295_03660 [Hujiaoplasma nucleasis]